MRFYLCSAFVLLITLMGIVSGQSDGAAFNNAAVAPKAAPTPGAGGSAKIGFAGYKGINIGSTAAEARTKLGTPREKSDQQDYYVISDGESTQVLYDTDKTVRTISTSYFGGSKMPTPLQVLGTDAEAKPDGSINKMVRFPKSGYSIQYIRTGGDDPIVMVTVQKIGKED